MNTAPIETAPTARAVSVTPRVSTRSSRLVTRDGTSLYYKDWGTGKPVVFSHGYPLSSDAWENQMFFLAQHGFRVIAHDRRGFGRSDQPSQGYDFNTFADDLAALIDHLDLQDVALVGHSMGAGEVARYVGRHGEDRVSQVALVGGVTPFLLKTDSNLGGAPKEVFDGFRTAVQADRSQWNKDVSLPYFGFNRPGAEVSQGVRDDYWRQGMDTGFMAAYHAIGAFSETDFREDLRRVTVPTLVIHGSDDQITPIEITGNLIAPLVPQAHLIVYDGAPHGLQITHKDRVNADLLKFLRA
jgi:non-heme chloroperoxidase